MGATGATGVVCYAGGTLIRTTRGEIAVEDLAIGDVAVTASGRERPIVWLGHRTIACRTHVEPNAVQPICIRKDAFGSGQPARDLLVSPGHGIAVPAGSSEALVPAYTLINGATVVQLDIERIAYWHVELDVHDLLLAEGLPAESYLEMDNRGFFRETAVVTLAALPDAPLNTLADFCRPVHLAGPVIEAARRHLHERALVLGWRLDRAPTAGMHLVVDSEVVEPVLAGLTAQFVLAAGARDVRLVSETSVPRNVNAHADVRTLGVCLAELSFTDASDTRRAVALDDERLVDGFQAHEAGIGRWTTGEALLPAGLLAGLEGPVTLTVRLARPAMPRWAAPGMKLDGGRTGALRRIAATAATILPWRRTTRAA